LIKLATKFFVKIIAPSKSDLIGLQKFELDLFQPTSKMTDNEFTIEGLLTLEQVGMVVENGYKVLVEEVSSKRTRSTKEKIEFSSWIQDTETRQARGIEAAAHGGYLSERGVETALQHLVRKYKPITELVTLPERTHENRVTHAVRIASGKGTRPGVLFIGGIHARELINPDLLITFGLNLCQAYTNGTGLNFGPKSYDSATIKNILDTLDVFIFPLVNPDGRAFVQSPMGDGMWRKNRNPNSGLPCKGVDLNRNYEFLWKSGIGTSASSCTDIFKGSAAFSEPETRNVKHMIDTFSNIKFMIDVHSYSELVLYPWGDDDYQTEDQNMNFNNPQFDGQRGTPGDSIYKEYIPKVDLDWFKVTGMKIKDAISSVRGSSYSVEPGIGLYPTSGTAHDFAYALHLVDTGNRKIMAYTVETAKEFQPTYSEALKVMSEVSAGLLEFCIACNSAGD
jgi:murein tripeptide amidase MpaA